MFSRFRSLCIGLGKLARRAGNASYDALHYRRAKYLLQWAMTFHTWSQNPQAVAQTLCSLARLEMVLGRYAQAEALYTRELALRQQEAAQDALSTVLNNLGLVCNKQERYLEAEAWYQQALAIDTTVLPPDHPDYAVTLGNLGLCYANLHRYQEAEALYQQTLAIEEQGDVPQHLAATLNNLAVLYEEEPQRYDEAEALHLRALAIRERCCGRMHPDTAQSLNNLAGLYVKKGKRKDAATLYRQALAIFKRCFPATHPDTEVVSHHLLQLFQEDSEL